MDGRQFDRITRALAAEQSRRSALEKAIALIALRRPIPACKPSVNRGAA